MRRQLGADTVELDTIESFARYELFRPRRIEIGEIEDAAYDASYTLMTVVVELEGDVVREPCETCGGEVAWLRIPETGQVLELEDDLPAEEGRRVRAEIVGWEGDHPRLRLLGSG